MYTQVQKRSIMDIKGEQNAKMQRPEEYKEEVKVAE